MATCGWRSPLSVAEAAAALGLGSAAVRTLLASGLIETVTPVRNNNDACYLVPQEAVDHFLKEYASFKHLKQFGLVSGSMAHQAGPEPVLRSHNITIFRLSDFSTAA